MTQLRTLVRDADGEPEGALVLLHGRGADERDLHPLLDALDPERRLVGITPRGPLALPPGGAHWYRFGGYPTPDPATFWPTYDLVAGWLNELPWPYVLGGFSQGAVMSYALGLGGKAAKPRALVCLSGFMPVVDCLELRLEDAPPVAIAHGSLDDVISVDWSREARRRLEAAGADVWYHEAPLPHTIDPRILPQLRERVAAAFA